MASRRRRFVARPLTVASLALSVLASFLSFVALSPSAGAALSTKSSPSHVAARDSSRPRASSIALANPAANIAPSPNFLQSGQCTGTSGTYSCTNPCVTSTMTWPAYTNATACTNFILGSINYARAAEGLVPMVLPSNWANLTTVRQLFVVANLERTARGYAPYLGLNSALSATAQRAARTNADPSLAAGFRVGKDAQGSPGMGGAWSGGFSVLAADYIWMYDDGWAGSRAATSNVVCTSSTAPGCWAHRDELLGSDPRYNPGVGLNCRDCEMGSGFAIVNGSGSFVDLVEIPAAAPPRMTFTWSHELALGY